MTTLVPPKLRAAEVLWCERLPSIINSESSLYSLQVDPRLPRSQGESFIEQLTAQSHVRVVDAAAASAVLAAMYRAVAHDGLLSAPR